MKKPVLILFSVICFFCAVFFVVFNFVMYPKKYKNYVISYSREFGLDSALVYAVIKTESNFDAKAVSPSNAMGLMQLIPTTAKWIAGCFDEVFDENQMFEPETNIKYGCFYLNYLKGKFSDFDAVICAYNAGETVVRTWLDENAELDEEKISYQETANYLKRVKGFYKVYKNREICL